MWIRNPIGRADLSFLSTFLLTMHSSPFFQSVGSEIHGLITMKKATRVSAYVGLGSNPTGRADLSFPFYFSSSLSDYANLIITRREIGSEMHGLINLRCNPVKKAIHTCAYIAREKTRH